ncbi:MAG: DUF3108 domain-containing protein [Kofleriaceae bacterium]
MRAVLLMVACGCNHLPITAASAASLPEPVAEPSVPAFVVPDETMSFVITFRGIQVANVQTAIGKPGWVDGRRAVIIKSLGRTEGFVGLIGDLRWELESTIDLDRGVPISDHEEAWAEFAGEKHHDDHHGTFDDSDHDVHSAISTLRGWHGGPKQHRNVRMQLGGGHFPIDIWRAGREVVFGRPALRFDGTADGDVHFSIWLSDDAARVPLLCSTETELGTIAVRLVEYG